MKLVICKALFVALLTGCAAKAVQEPAKEVEPEAQPSIVGVWQLVEDESKPGESPREEIHIYEADGRFKIISETPTHGRYSVEGNRVNLVAAAFGVELEIEMEFAIEGDTMRVVAQSAQGARYKRIERDVPPWSFTDDWENIAEGIINVAKPAGWEVERMSDPNTGRILVALTNKNSTKNIMLIMAAAGVPGEGLANLIIDSTTSEIGLEGEKIVSPNAAFHGRSGGTLIKLENIRASSDSTVKLEAGEQINIVAYVETLDSGETFAMVSIYEKDQLDEIGDIVRSIQITPAATLAE